MQALFWIALNLHYFLLQILYHLYEKTIILRTYPFVHSIVPDVLNISKGFFMEEIGYSRWEYPKPSPSEIRNQTGHDHRQISLRRYNEYAARCHRNQRYCRFRSFHG